MHNFPRHRSCSRINQYANELRNESLFQTDFAAIERRRWLSTMQLHMAARESLAGYFRELYRQIYRALRKNGLLHGMPSALAILKRDAIEAIQ